MGPETIIKNAPRLVQLAQGLLKQLSSTATVIDTVKTAAKTATSSATETLATIVADAGVAKNIFGAGQLPELKEFIAGLNGQATPTQKQLLEEVSKIMEQGGGIDPANKKELEGILQRFASPDEIINPDMATTPGENTSNAAAKNAAAEERIRELEAQLKAQGETTSTASIKSDEDKIFDNVCHIVDGEMKLNGSPLSWGLSWLLARYGVDLKKGGIKTLMEKYASPAVKKSLGSYLKAGNENDKNAILAALGSEEERSALTMASSFVNVAKNIPSWAIEAFSYAAEILDWGEHFLRGVPIIGTILKIPFARKALVSTSQLADRFRQNLHDIREASQAMTA